MHSSCAVAEGAYSISAGAAIEVGLARYHILYPLKQNSGEHMESETGKDIPTQGDSPAQALGTLSPRKEMSQAHSPFSHSEVSRGSKDYLLVCLRQTSPT